MKITSCKIIITACLWASLSFSYDYVKWEIAIKNSDLTFFAHVNNDDKISKTELMGLLVLANEIIQQRKDDILDHKHKIYTSIVLKLIPIGGIGPLIGFILDQRALGVTLGISSLMVGTIGTLTKTAELADDEHLKLAVATCALGLTATATAAISFAFLERWFWQKERTTYDNLEKAFHHAVAIKAYLTTLAAKNR